MLSKIYIVQMDLATMPATKNPTGHQTSQAHQHMAADGFDRIYLSEKSAGVVCEN